MRFGKLRTVGVLALTFAVGGCGDAGPGGAPITLTTTEVNQLFDEIGGIFEQANISRAAPGVLLSRMPRIDLNSAVNVSETINCAGGGSAAISGTSATDGSSVDLTATFTACKTTHYTVDGSLQESGSITSTAITETAKGDLGIKTADNRSGSCHIDFTVSITGLGGNSATASVTGTICGVDAKTISAVQ